VLSNSAVVGPVAPSGELVRLRLWADLRSAPPVAAISACLTAMRAVPAWPPLLISQVI
jgi:hypothetical protein